MRYHPDPLIDREVHADAQASERADLAAGYPPRRWRCDCGAEHERGHFPGVGIHRCLACGYVGDGGTLLDPAYEASEPPEWVKRLPLGHPRLCWVCRGPLNPDDEGPECDDTGCPARGERCTGSVA